MAQPNGRPREHDYEKEADDLEEWSKSDDAISLYQFTDKKPYLAQDLADFANGSVKFRLALKKAKERIGCRRELLVHTNKFNYGVWARAARLYDPLINAKEDQDKDEDAIRKAKSLQAESELQGATLARMLQAAKDGKLSQDE